MMRFGRFARRNHQRRGEGTPAPFDFLGFTHYCGRARAGRFKLKRKTSGKKFRVKLEEMRLWFHHQLSTPIGDMWQVLNAKLRGHYQYYGINDNWPMLMVFRSTRSTDGQTSPEPSEPEELRELEPFQSLPSTSPGEP